MHSPPFLTQTVTAQQWKEIGTEPHHGLIIPLFSLHSEQSCGIGEFLDLLPMIDWCESIGMDVIQLLPLNDTGLDTSPYSAISAYALNPIHLSLFALPELEKYPNLQQQLKLIQGNTFLNRINYPEVRLAKEQFLRSYYASIKESIPFSSKFQEFKQKQFNWLPGYALFRILKAKQGWIHWEHWPIELQSPTSEQLDLLFDQYQEEIEFHSFIQFLCHLQLSQVKEYAHLHHVFIMGDIPILISRDSADVWLNRTIFDMNYSAGAPPDMYALDGQDWGFPIYNWEELEKEGYRWWIDRLRLASDYYHLYRIDHIVGFFRIWSIPLGKTGKEGYFIPQDVSSWIEHGRKILTMMIENCSMLPIGEDLGTVPPEVRMCLSSLGICGTKVTRWEKDWDGTKEFLPINTYPLASMTTVSTHDSETLQLWWRNKSEEAKDYANFKGWSYHPVLNRDYHYEILWDSHHSNSLFHINLLQEYFALIPGLTWPNLEDERINIPGIYSEINWSYRFKPSVEELIHHQTLTHLLKEIIL